MTVVLVNPNRCCTTCADFPDCDTCGDAPSVKTLSIEIEDAPPNVSYSCKVCGVAGPKGSRSTSWVNLEGTYELEQDPLDKTKYSIEFGDAELCSDARTEGILVDDHETGSCIGTSPDPQVYIPDRQKEVYVSGITVVLECVNNRMQIASMAFTFCECSRVYDRFAMPPAWGSWTCEYLNEYPATGSQPNNLICELGDQLATVLPCTEDRMEREIVWPTISAASCDISFTCGTPVTGKLSATLQC